MLETPVPFNKLTQIFVNVSGTYQEVNEAYANVRWHLQISFYCL